MIVFLYKYKPNAICTLLHLRNAWKKNMWKIEDDRLGLFDHVKCTLVYDCKYIYIYIPPGK